MDHSEPSPQIIASCNMQLGHPAAFFLSCIRGWYEEIIISHLGGSQNSFEGKIVP